MVMNFMTNLGLWDLPKWWISKALQWHYNGHDSVSNHQPHDCLLNHLFNSRSKKNQSSASLAFVRGIHRWLVNSPHRYPETRKMFPFDDIIIVILCDHYKIWNLDIFRHPSLDPHNFLHYSSHSITYTEILWDMSSFVPESSPTWT